MTNQVELQLMIEGRTKAVVFNFMGDPAHIPYWESQGLNVVECLPIEKPRLELVK